MPLGASQHIFAGLKRTRDQKLSSGLLSFGCHFTGLMLLTFHYQSPLFSPNFAFVSQDRVQQRLHPQRELYTMSVTRLCTLVSPCLPCASCRSVDRLEATSFLSAFGVGLLIAVLSGVFTARQMKNELCVSPHSFEVLAVCVRSRIQKRAERFSSPA